MKNRILKTVATFLMMATVCFFAGCDRTLEMPEWLEQELCDHVYDDQKVLDEATCTKDGRMMKICSSCGKMKISVIPGGHTVEESADIPATCTTPGMTAGAHCTTCGLVLKESEVIEAFGHTTYDTYCGNCGIRLWTDNY